jgi:hypothetical protein
MKIVALGHRRAVGKDTAAECLIEKGWMAISFADHLKRSLSKLYNIPIEYFHRRDLKDQRIPALNASPRDLMISFGTDTRDRDPDHWIRALHLSLLDMVSDAGVPGIVITDLRFPNELQYLRRLGATTIRIDRRDVEVSNDIADCALANEPDESFDHIIDNCGSKEDLWERISGIADSIPNLSKLNISHESQ